MRKYLLHVLIVSFVFLYPLILHAENGRGIDIVIKDSKGKQVGMYKGSHALVIGVSDYKAGWQDLESIPNEIDKVEEALNKQGFNIVKVMNPDSDSLENAFKGFIDKYGYDEQNRLLFFYSGHGYTRKDGKKGYLVPVDAPDPNDDDKGFVRKSLNMSQIVTWARNIEAKHALFLFDSCFSGTIFKTKSKAVPRHISHLTSRPVRQFISAGSAGEEVPATSIFVPSFVRGLDGEADIDEDGYITGTELGSYLYKKVLYYDAGQTPQYGKIRDPELDEGDFVFALGRDVYEQPQAHLPSSPGGTGKLDFGDIEADSKNAKKLAEIKEQWTTWQGNLNASYDEAIKYDKDTYLSAAKKAQVWKRLANSFSQDNPYSTEDQLIRSKAMDRLKYWKNYKEPKPAIVKPPVVIREEQTLTSILKEKKLEGVKHNKIINTTKDPNEAIALVNGEAIIRLELDMILDKVKQSTDTKRLHLVEEKIIKDLVTQFVLKQFIRKENIQVDSNRIEEEINTFRENIRSNPESADKSLETLLEEQGGSIDELRVAMDISLSIDEYLNRTTSEEEMKKYFTENIGVFNSETVTASHILIDTRTIKDEEGLKKAKEDTERLKKELDNGADFAKLAEENSDCPSAKSGGELGVIARGQMVDEFEETAFNTELNGISEPVKTKFGYHIIKITDKQAGKDVTFEETKDNVKLALFNEKTMTLIQELNDKADVNILYKPAPYASDSK